MLAAQVANLASLGKLGVAGRVFAAEERIQMSESLGAVAVTRDRVDMDMVGYSQMLVTHVTARHPHGERRYLRNGPPSLGRLLKRTLNQTPMPSGLEVAVMEPLTLPPAGKAALSKAVSGKVAEKTTPGGLETTTVALPRSCSVG